MEKSAKPFLKWAGGKGQLSKIIESSLPSEFLAGEKIPQYSEPFLGSGAVFFHLRSRYEMKEIVLSDTNQHLVRAFTVVRDHVDRLISDLYELASEYLRTPESRRAHFFYERRAAFNLLSHRRMSKATSIEATAHLLFLNRTCFNGLYRVNRAGDFNVPHGKYKNPNICDVERLSSASHALKGAKIVLQDFDQSLLGCSNNAFVYLDPPYRPLSQTSSFTAYTAGGFDDTEQERLQCALTTASGRGIRWLLSNSDPKNNEPHDEFFDLLYRDFEIRRVLATRAINSRASDRGAISELLIRNYNS